MKDLDLVINEAKQLLTKTEVAALENDLYDSMNTTEIMRAARRYNQAVDDLNQRSIPSTEVNLEQLESHTTTARLQLERQRRKLIEEINHWRDQEQG